MFLTSTLYHSMAHNTQHKYIMRLLDHSLIYVAIAGTYTPIALSVIGGTWGTPSAHGSMPRRRGSTFI